MTPDLDTVVLLDLDNTLIDHDELKRRVSTWVERKTSASPDEFWAIYEAIRSELDIVDFLETARRFGEHLGSRQAGDELRRFLWDFPFERIVLPGTFDVLRRLGEAGTLAVLCDGEPAFQRRKLWRLDLLDRLDHVFVFKHKEHHFHDVEARYPGRRFVLFDDKPRIIRAAREHFGDRLTAVHVRHGHYASESPPDAHLSVNNLRDFAARLASLS